MIVKGKGGKNFSLYLGDVCITYHPIRFITLKNKII